MIRPRCVAGVLTDGDAADQLLLHHPLDVGREGSVAEWICCVVRSTMAAKALRGHPGEGDTRACRVRRELGADQCGVPVEGVQYRGGDVVDHRASVWEARVSSIARLACSASRRRMFFATTDRDTLPSAALRHQFDQGQLELGARTSHASTHARVRARVWASVMRSRRARRSATMRRVSAVTAIRLLLA
jgi:hypothetical protein